MNRVLATDLYKALKKVKITKISASPILNHARIEFINGELLLTSTDLENTFESKCACILEEEWATCVPMQGKKNNYKVYPFLDFIKVCAGYNDLLAFTFDPKIQVITIKVVGERSITTFKCMDSVEFPQTKTIE